MEVRDKNFYTAVLVDDEKPALEVLKYLLEVHCPDVKITGCFQNPELARQHILSEKPELAFVDIKMNNVNGLQFIESIASQSTKFIFTTAHHEFALEAWKTKAISYLLKPIDPQELLGTMSKIKSLDWELHDNLESYIKLGAERIKPSEILSIEADGAYSIIRLTNNSEILLSKNLKGILALLPEDDFYRIHRSHIININHLIKVNSDGRTIALTGNLTYEISERKLLEFMNHIRHRSYGRN